MPDRGYAQRRDPASGGRDPIQVGPSRRPKAVGKLKPADLKYLREIYDEAAVPIQDRRGRARAMEKRLADLVNRAYGLTPDEAELLWSTAPPRMPVGR